LSKNAESGNAGRKFGEADLEHLDARGMLEVWGRRVSGGSLKDPLKLSTGSCRGTDDESALVLYVEMTFGFELVRPVLVHVFAEGRSLSSYAFRQVGESRVAAAMRHGRGCRISDGWSDLEIADDALRSFMRRLGRKIKRRPFRIPRSVEDVPPEQIAAEAEYNGESKFPDRFRRIKADRRPVKRRKSAQGAE
jgi:hypothetical protein